MYCFILIPLYGAGAGMSRKTYTDCIVCRFFLCKNSPCFSLKNLSIFQKQKMESQLDILRNYAKI